MGIYRTAIDKLDDYIDKYQVESDMDKDIILGIKTACDILRVNENTKYVYVLAGHKSEVRISEIIGVYNQEQDAIDNLYEIADIKKKYSDNYDVINIDIKSNQVYTDDGHMHSRYMIHKVKII